MGEKLKPVVACFNRSLRIESRTDRLTGDPGAVVLRDILERSGIVGWMAARLKDPRSQVDVTHDLASLIRTRVLLAAQGWRDDDDADALRHDPALRLAASSEAGLTPLEGAGLASQPTLSRFTALMAEPANLKVLREAVLEFAGRGIKANQGGKRLPSMTLDVDSAPIEVHGHQPKAEWNGHYNARICHPLITSIAETGDMLDARLRAGNVGAADGALDVILDVVDRARESFCDVAMVRIDAGFPSAPLLKGLEARGIDYVSRLRANPVLDRLAGPPMKRPPGRRPAEPRMWLYELRYQADSWDKPRRVILVVKEREGDLPLDRFLLVTSPGWTTKTRHEVLAHYRERGKAEGHMGELKDVLALALPSTNRAKSHLRGKAPKSRSPAVDAFACNEVRLLPACLACEVMHVARRVMAKTTGTSWSLRRLRERVLRAGARLVISGRRMTLALSSAAAPFWAALWPGIPALHWSDPWPQQENRIPQTRNAHGRRVVMHRERRIALYESLPPRTAASQRASATATPDAAARDAQHNGLKATKRPRRTPKTGSMNLPGSGSFPRQHQPFTVDLGSPASSATRPASQSAFVPFDPGVRCFRISSGCCGSRPSCAQSSDTACRRRLGSPSARRIARRVGALFGGSMLAVSKSRRREKPPERRRRRVDVAVDRRASGVGVRASQSLDQDEVAPVRLCKIA